MEHKRNTFSAAHRILSFCIAIALAITIFPGGIANPLNVSAADITSGPINITADGNYIIEGNNTPTSNTITVARGVNCTITLSRVIIRTAVNVAPMFITNGGSNTAPETKVELILDGYNELISGYDVDTVNNNAAGLQVGQGAQVTISAIDPANNASGTLLARCNKKGYEAPNAGGASGYGNAAGIGAANSATIKGGNVVITSGTIHAYGGDHGAGIGGAHSTCGVYDGLIAITGGVVDSHGGGHSAGIGSGCPTGGGNNGGNNGAGSIVVLPPADVTATTLQAGTPALGGLKESLYLGDPSAQEIWIRTVDSEPSADIYFDISENASFANVLDIVAPTYNYNSVKVGTTGTNGLLKTSGVINQNVTIFTDKSSSTAPNVGKPYTPVKKAFPQGQGAPQANPVILPLLDLKLEITDMPSIPLLVGYTGTQADTNAQGVRIKYNETSETLSNVQFDIQGATGGSTSNFSGLQFFAADGTTPISAPTTLTPGMEFVIRTPISTGKPEGIYSDVLRISGHMDTKNLDTGYIRRVITQKVVVDDTNSNNYIKVTASPSTFLTNNNPARTVTLTMTIDHTGLSKPYDQSDVQAKYIITTKKNYADISPTDPGWTALTTNATGAAQNTTTSFSGLTDGEYYIHWSVVSGTVMAHSRDFVSPPAHLYGAFGPYTINTAKPIPSILVNGLATTPQEFTSFAAQPVKITFNKSIDPTTLTAADFDIIPAGLGAIGVITAVAGTDNKEFTTTITPSNTMYNGQEVQVSLKANSVTDLAGNTNDVASNVIALKFKQDAAIPTVSFGNAALYNTKTPSFDVTYDPGDTAINGNNTLFSDAAAATPIADGANIASHFTVRNAVTNAIVSTGYTVTYHSATKTATFAFQSTANLANSTEYKVTVERNKVYNKLHNGNVEMTSSNFKIAVPEVTSITPASSTVAYDQGNTKTLTINGVNLDQIPGGKITVAQTGAGTATYQATITSPTTATFIPNLPVNATNAPQNYTFEEQHSASGKKTATITVSPPSAEVTSLQANQTIFPYTGGTLNMTVNGLNLNGVDALEIRRTETVPTGATNVFIGSNTITLSLPSGNGTHVITVPAQTLNENDSTTVQTATFEVYLKKNGGSFVATGQTLTVTVAGKPEVTNITPQNTTLPSNATGIPTLTVNGLNLDQIVSGTITVVQTNPDATTTTWTAVVTDSSKAVLSSVILPVNMDNITKAYVFQAKSPVIAGANEGQTATITLKAATPELGDGSGLGNGLTADPTLIENDDSLQSKSSTLKIVGQNLHNFTALEIHCDDGRTFPIALSDMNSERTEASIVVSLPYNSAIADKLYNFEVYIGGNPSGHKATVTVEGSKPKVTSVTANPAEHSSAGGSSLFTILGKYLNNADPLSLVDSLGGTYVVSAANIAADGKSATLTIGFSGNAGPRNDIHNLEAYIADSGTGQSAAVEVGDSIPFVERATATPAQMSVADTMFGNGRSTISIYGGYFTRARSLELYDTINRATYSVSIVDNDVNTYVVTVPSNVGVYTYNVLMDGIDTGIFAEVRVGIALGQSDPNGQINPEDENISKKPAKDKEWTGRGGGAKGGVWSGSFAWTAFDLLFHHARKAVKNDPDNAIMTLKDVWCITQPQLNRAMTGARADIRTGKVTIYFDTMDEQDNSILEGRLMLNPEDANFYHSHLYPMVFTNDYLTGKTKALFAGRFDNEKIAVIRLSQIGEYKSKVEIAANVDLTGFNTENLYLYLYIPETGEYKALSDMEYSIDKEGLLHFAPIEGGDIVITDKPLTQGGKAFRSGSFPVEKKEEDKG